MIFKNIWVTIKPVFLFVVVIEFLVKLSPFLSRKKHLGSVVGGAVVYKLVVLLNLLPGYAAASRKAYSSLPPSSRLSIWKSIWAS